MRQYMLAICTLSIFYFALAAPVTVPPSLEVRSNAVAAPKDGIVMWEKRRDLNPRYDSYGSDATSQYQGPEDTVHGGWEKGNYPGNADDSDSDSDDDGSDDDNDNSNNDDSNNNDDDDEDETDNTNNDETDNESDDDADDEAESDDDDPNDEGERESYHGEHGSETPEHMSGMSTMADFEELLGQFMHRARDSGLGAVGSQKRGVAGNR